MKTITKTRVRKSPERAFVITWSEVVENHIGNQQIGKLGERGVSCEELAAAAEKMRAEGYVAEVHKLEDYVPTVDRAEAKKKGAHVLVVRKFLDDETVCCVDKEMWRDDIMDKKAIMGMGKRRKVMNKHARWNNCIAETAQPPEYEEGKGTVVAFDSVPTVANIRVNLYNLLGDIAKNLFAETNYYYDVSKTGIGWHGTLRGLLNVSRLC